MTPRNPLDGKVIVDREILEQLLAIAERFYADPNLNLPDARMAAQQALAQDNTGWAAVPILSTMQMDCAGANNVFDNLSRASETWSAMLAASPPLGGGE